MLCCFNPGDSHSVLLREANNNYQRSFKRQQKVHTRVIDAKLNQIYFESVNSTLEYIFQYTYPQDVSSVYQNLLYDVLKLQLYNNAGPIYFFCITD